MNHEYLRILVVEDNPGDFVLVSEQIYEEYRAAKVTQAGTLAAAKKMVAENDYDAILIDLSLPDSTGIDSVKELIDIAELVPLIILTAYADEQMAIQALQLGAQDYLIKDGCNARMLAQSIRHSMERKKLYETVKTSEEQYRYLFYNNPLPMLTYRIDNSQITMVNEAAVRHYGYSREEFLSKTILEIRPAEDLPKLLAYKKELHAPGLRNAGEWRHVKKDGTIIDVEVVLHEVEQSGVACRMAVIHDITSEKKHKLEKERMIEELIRTNHDLQQFSYITSHNLRAPISNLLGIMALLDPGAVTDETAALLLEGIKKSTEDLNQTVNDLIQVLIIKSGSESSYEPVRISESYRKVQATVSQLIKDAHAVISTDFSAADTVLFNIAYLDSILLNLTTNAIRYRDPARPLHIDVMSEDVDNYVLLSFSDNGSGINLERYGDRIFGLYQRFHDHPDSKGLGLYMVKTQITQMGGKISVESTPGVGTTFKIYFKKHTHVQ
jgi:PAS domain S-box-containing protein